MAECYDEEVVVRSTIHDILVRNGRVEEQLKAKTTTGSLIDATVALFLSLTSKELKDFIHARRFNDKTFHESKLVGPSGKLNKTKFRGQSAESIERDTTEDDPCLVWLAWKLRAEPIVLEERPEPVMNTSLQTPEFSVVYVRPESVTPASAYLLNET